MYDPEGSWNIFLYLENFKDAFGNWSFLPEAGGLLDQSEYLMHDLLIWRGLARRAVNQAKEMKKADNPNG